jgi:hypothetical protein
MPTLDAFGAILRIPSNKPRKYVDIYGPAPRPIDEFMFFVISKGRPQNVEKIEQLFDGTGMHPTWIVGEGEASQYLSYGALDAVEGGGLCPSRNLALNMAREQEKVCVQMSDDIKKIQFAEGPMDEWKVWDKEAARDKGNAYAVQACMCHISPVTCARVIEQQMRRQEAKLGGIYVSAALHSGAP